MEAYFKNKTILVTGAGQGIGQAICQRLHAYGAKVIGISRSPKPLDDLKHDCPGIQTIAVDLADWTATRTALQSLPSVDGLVNNAGIAIIKPFAELTEQDFDDTMAVNIKAAFNVCQIVTPHMKPGSSIVNISSLAALIGVNGHAAYSISKAAIDGLTKSLALELGDRNIRCNSVNPTVILTRMGRENWSDPATADPVKQKIPLHRFGEVHEVVDPVCFLLSDKSSYINGHCMPIEGGYRAN